MTTIAENLQGVTARIARAAAAAGRDPVDVALVAVSKTFPAQCIAEARAAGQRAFGENYLQEALAKQAALADASLEWHFVGPIQSNKARAIAEHFAWVHGVDRLKVAERLSAARPASLPPLNVLLQVNVDAEDTKSGVAAAELPALAQAVARLPRLALRGLMALPRPEAEFAAQRRAFARLRALRDALAAAGLALDTLSMGMSADLEAAIAEGSTMVRVGTAVFGERAAR